MKDRERALSRPADAEYAQAEISQALASAFHPRTHEAFGEGGVHIFGGEALESSQLEVWPQAKVVRLQTPTTAIALSNQQPPIEIDLGGLGFQGSVLFTNQNEAYYTTLLVRSDGGVVFMASPQEAIEAPAGGSSRNGNDGRLGGEQGRVDRSDDGKTLSSEPTIQPSEEKVGQRVSYPAADGQVTKEKQPKIRLEGDVLNAPIFRPADQKRQAHVRFQLAEEGETHDVYSTKQNAERIATLELQAGERVRVTGIRHQNEQQQPTLYAFGVKRLSTDS